MTPGATKKETSKMTETKTAFGGRCSGEPTDPDMLERFGDMILFDLARSIMECDQTSPRCEQLEAQYVSVLEQMIEQGSKWATEVLQDYHRGILWRY